MAVVTYVRCTGSTHGATREQFSSTGGWVVWWARKLSHAADERFWRGLGVHSRVCVLHKSKIERLDAD